MRCIHLCQKLELSENITEKKTNLFLICNAAGIQLVMFFIFKNYIL